MKFRKKELFGLLVLAALAGFLPLTGCGSSGGTTTPTTTTSSSDTTSGSETNSSGETISSLTSGYSVPSDISAVPESNSDSSAHIRSFSRAVSALGADTDYQKAIPSKYVEEPVLDQFEIIEQVLSAINQTKYYEDANINNGPYKAMVAWTDEENGREVKTLEPWIIDSRMIVIDGNDVNRVLAWIEESDPETGETELVKAEFKVSAEATFDDEGEVTSYGEWELNVKFDDAGDDFFVATAAPNGSGGTTININEYEVFSETEPPHLLKGILNRSNTTGYGKMQFTDWETCNEWPCTPKTSEAAYAYNATYLGVKKTEDVEGAQTEQPLVYKDRTSKVEMTHRYGMFYDEDATGTGSTGKAIAAGDDIMKHKRFGFPVFYETTDNSGNTIRVHAYYGAWQGRHELWAGDAGGSISAGATLTKESWGDAEPEEYTVAAAINGSFTKRTLADASLNDIKGVPVETWVNKHFDMLYGDFETTGDDWYYCKGYIDWSTYNPTDPANNPPTCRTNSGTTSTFTKFTAYDELVIAGEDDRKWVDIGSWDESTQTDTQYVYLNDTIGANYTGYSDSGAGFYEAERNNSTGQLTVIQPLSLYAPAAGDQLWVSIGGSIYIAYTGTGTTGWVQKTLASFDQREWKPVFDDNADVAFNPQIGREYYMNANGVNYVTRRIAETGTVSSDYEVKLEIQKTANPENCTASNSCSTIVPAAAAYFRTPWNPDVRFDLVIDQTSSDYLLLTYLNDDPNTDSVTEAAGDVVTSGMWGLQAWADNSTPSDYADDYPLDSSGSAVTVDDWGIPTNLDQRPVEFNWEYCNPSSNSGEGGGCWGSQTYLKDSNNAYVILSDPIALEAIQATNGAGDTKNLLLQYDGWLHGMPNIHDTLRENDWQITQEIKDKIINIPAGTAVSDGTNGYYLKPMETSVFLEIVDESAIPSGSVPDVSQAAGLDLSTLPEFSGVEIGDMPTVTTVKYSEGVLVE